LAQVYGIVKQHQGHIDVETAVGEGTTFRLYLPIHDSEKRVPLERRSSLLPGRGETILLVEDEAKVREATGRVLESLGYRALTAANGREAQELAEERNFDLLITDLVMPEMGGRDLIKELGAKRPDLKAIAMTGYAVEGDVQDLAIDVIQKPLDLQSLAQIVRAALDA
jgi:CheY-like chemotaxis protein